MSAKPWRQQLSQGSLVRKGDYSDNWISSGFVADDASTTSQTAHSETGLMFTGPNLVLSGKPYTPPEFTKPGIGAQIVQTCVCVQINR